MSKCTTPGCNNLGEPSVCPACRIGTINPNRIRDDYGKPFVHRTIANDPAYPCQRDGVSHYGLTKREEIASRIMAGIMAAPDSLENRIFVASAAVKIADALIAELDK